MATQDDVRRLALALPEVVEAEDRLAFEVLNKGKLKGICWVWLERIRPKKARVPQPAALAIRTAGLDEKQMLLDSDPEGDKFFTEPHYNGYPAILVWLEAIEPDELAELIIDAWRCMAPKVLVAEFDGLPG